MRRVILLAASVVAAAVLAAGCGGGSRASATQANDALASAPAPRINPYKASLAFARCMRAHGVPHPDPDRNGDFHLTPAGEARMRTAGPKKHEAAEKACFHLLKGTVSTQPLSRQARQAAIGPLSDLKRCLHGHGYEVGKPLVRNMSRGRAMFGFERAAAPRSAEARARLQAAQQICEKQTKLAARLDAIIKADRGEDR